MKNLLILLGIIKLKTMAQKRRYLYKKELSDFNIVEGMSEKDYIKWKRAIARSIKAMDETMVEIGDGKIASLSEYHAWMY